MVGTTLSDRRELAREAVARLAADPEVTGAFLAGSLTVGLGNRTSDVDAYLIGPGLTEDRHQVFAGAVRVDVHRIDRAGLEAAVGRVVRATIRSDDGAAGPPERDVTIAVMLSRGEIVLDEGGALSACQRSLTGRTDRLRRLVINRWLTAAHYHLEDLAGLAGEGDDAEAATMVSRRLLHAAGKAVAAACGELYPGDKWVWRQLDRSAPAEFPHAEFRRLLRADPLAGGRPGLGDLQSLAQACLAAAATLGWQSVPLSRWPAWRGGDGPLRRVPGLSIRAYDDAALITTPAGRRVRLRPDVALIWALCDGVTGQVLRQAAARLRDGGPAYASLTARRTDDLVERLVRAGLVARDGRA